MNETIKVLTGRASCTAYKPEHIKKEEMEQIIRAGLNAPSGMNKQTPKFVVVQNEEMVKKLSEMNAKVMGTEMEPFYGAPDVIVVLVKKDCTYMYDGSLAMGNLQNAAYALGIGSRWIHRAKEIFASPEGKELLKSWGVEEDVEGVGFCILGYPAEGWKAAEKEIRPGRVFYV